MDKNKLYQELFNVYKSAYPNKKAGILQGEAVTFWKSVKHENNFEKRVNAKIKELKLLRLKGKQQSISFWIKASQAQPKNSSISTAAIRSTIETDVPLEDTDIPTSSSKVLDEEKEDTRKTMHKTPAQEAIQAQPKDSSISTAATRSTTETDAPLEDTDIPTNSSKVLDERKEDTRKTMRKTPAQEAILKKIVLLDCDINTLNVKKNANLLTSKEFDQLKQKNKELDEARKKLKTLKQGMERASRSRANVKRKIQQITHDNPDAEKILKTDKRGRPTLEANQPGLLETIINIATYGSAVDSRRRTELIRSVTTLDDLVNILRTDYGYNVSRSGIYLRLIPRRIHSIEGKKHIHTVPVKLMKAQNSSHKEHIDSKFAAATIKNLELMSSVLGPAEVFFLSQDDKARIPIGLTAANKQSPLLMHMEYRVTLPDHDWVVAPSHKLIPSVYAGIKIQNNQINRTEAVTYSGPTYIAIRSAKHSSSNAFTHCKDFEHHLQIPEFEEMAKNSKGAIKPVCICTVDGGPDENPRYMNVIKTSVHHFVTNDLDALFVACNAPGRSAFNRVERRMAPLSKELSGVILPYDHYGTHLNNRAQTTDKELEIRNFAHAGQTLAEIWSQIEFDGFPVVCDYIDTKESNVTEIQEKSMLWQKNHVRSSQYLLQIIKCQDENCCSPFRSSIMKILPNRFMPPPIQIDQTDDGLCIAENAGNFAPLFLLQTLMPNLSDKFKGIQKLPYDYSCPSVKKDIDKKTCKTCQIYFASLTYLKEHQKICSPATSVLKVRSVRIAAKRQRELLAIILNEDNQEDAEWLEEDMVDTASVLIPAFDSSIENPAPIFSIEQHYTTPWVD